MKILVTGASGLVGRSVVALWRAQNHQVYQVSRKPDRLNSFSLGYGDSIPEVNAIINLAGELVLGYWTEGKKERILKSRLETTRWVIAQIRRMKQKPQKLISASAVGIYGDQAEALIDERSGFDLKRQFLYQVCREWEAVADEAQAEGVRVTKVRLGNVFVWGDRFLGAMKLFWSCGIFPRLAAPETWMPWISLRDQVRMLDWILQMETPPEVVNGVTQNPLRWSELEMIVRKNFPIKITVPVDCFGMRYWMGEMATMIQSSQRVISSEASIRGFEYLDPNFESYLKEIRK